MLTKVLAKMFLNVKQTPSVEVSHKAYIEKCWQIAETRFGIPKASESVDILKKEWKLDFSVPVSSSHHPLSMSVGICEDMNSRLLPKTAQEFNSYDGVPDLEHIPRLDISIQGFELGKEQGLEKLVKQAVLRSYEMGAMGRTQVYVKSPEELSAYYEMGFILSKEIIEPVEKLSEIFSNPGQYYVRQSKDTGDYENGLSFDIRYGVRMYLPSSKIRDILQHRDYALNKPVDEHPASLSLIEEQKLFPSSLDNISITQNPKNGDCYFVSAIRGLAGNLDGRRSLGRLFKSIGSGIYKISLPSGKSILISERDYLSNSLELSRQKSLSGDLGYQLLEVAMSKFALKDKYGVENHPALALAMIRGGYPGEILHKLTGWELECLNTKGENKLEVYKNTFAEKEKIDKKLRIFLNNLSRNFSSYIVTAGTPNYYFPKSHENGEHFMDQENQRFPANHAYTIVGISDSEIKIIDPKQGDFVHTITYDEFSRFFSAIHTVKVPEENLGDYQ